MKQHKMDILQNKKIFITGHSGFKGSWLCKMLNMLGSNVVGYSIDHRKALHQILKVNGLCSKEYFNDICDYKSLKHALSIERPDIVFHLAAQPLVRQSYNIPMRTFDVNTVGTLNALEAVRELKLKCAVICITTDKVYANNENGIPFKEDDPLGGHDPYSASKAAAEIAIDSYRKSFFNPQQYGKTHYVQLASARAGNVIGGGDFAEDRIIPDIIRATKDHNVLSIRNPRAIRPWQHVIEPLYGYIMLASKMANLPYNPVWSSSWNFGPLESSFVEVEKIVVKAREVLDFAWKDAISQQNAHEAQTLKLDVSKARDVLGWNPIWNIDKTLNETFKWYKAWMIKKDLESLIERQINEYLSII